MAAVFRFVSNVSVSRLFRCPLGNDFFRLCFFCSLGPKRQIQSKQQLSSFQARTNQSETENEIIYFFCFLLMLTLSCCTIFVNLDRVLMATEQVKELHLNLNTRGGVGARIFIIHQVRFERPCLKSYNICSLYKKDQVKYKQHPKTFLVYQEVG